MIKRLVTIFCLCALGLSVAACDKCGDWLRPSAPGLCQTPPPAR